ncbi:hypothetical protein [Amycolatopsis sp. WQ 127309]|uniref:beta family protein n=1 Tax=Amycolatopsis sp. WQ 127309 TaxID=2932773 RepID=UPI00353030BF
MPRTDRIDLILDLQYIGKATTSQLDEAAAILDVVAELGGFRSVVLLSGSIPRTLAQTSTWEQPRTEETHWANLVRAAVADLQMGDYGTVHPIPGGGFRSNHVAMKARRAGDLAPPGLPGRPQCGVTMPANSSSPRSPSA